MTLWCNIFCTFSHIVQSCEHRIALPGWEFKNSGGVILSRSSRLWPSSVVVRRFVFRWLEFISPQTAQTDWRREKLSHLSVRDITFRKIDLGSLLSGKTSHSKLAFRERCFCWKKWSRLCSVVNYLVEDILLKLLFVNSIGLCPSFKKAKITQFWLPLVHHCARSEKEKNWNFFRPEKYSKIGKTDRRFVYLELPPGVRRRPD